MILENKTILITGAKGGLGTFVTNAFLDAGARVIGVSRSIGAADFAHPSFVALPAAISSRESAASVAAECGRIDALVHLMGAFAGGKSVVDSNDDTLDRMFDLNFRSAYY